jgi:hypothetical protein
MKYNNIIKKEANMATLSSIFDLYQGDYIKIDFPENFILEYKVDILNEESLASFICTRMYVYRYDEEDRDDINYYFYGTNPKAQWVTKSYYLTKESYSKVCDYLTEKLAREGKIEIDKNGYIIKPYRV